MGERWVEWIEPFGPNNEPVYLRVPESTAIASAKHRWGSHPTRPGYSSDQDALDDFMIVHWATFRKEE